MAVEQAVAAVPSAQVLGPLTLETLPLKSSLKSEAASWKAQFAGNLHKQGADDLKVCPRSMLLLRHADSGCAAVYSCFSEYALYKVRGTCRSQHVPPVHADHSYHHIRVF